MKEQAKDNRKQLPSMMPTSPLKLESNMLTTNFDPPRTLGLVFISSTAASMATFATLPMTELKVRIAPMCTTAGLEETFLLTTASENSPKQRTNNPRNPTIFMVGKNLEVQKGKLHDPIPRLKQIHNTQNKRNIQENPKADIPTSSMQWNWNPCFFHEHIYSNGLLKAQITNKGN